MTIKMYRKCVFPLYLPNNHLLFINSADPDHIPHSRQTYNIYSPTLKKWGYPGFGLSIIPAVIILFPSTLSEQVDRILRQCLVKTYNIYSPALKKWGYTGFGLSVIPSVHHSGCHNFVTAQHRQKKLTEFYGSVWSRPTIFIAPL